MNLELALLAALEHYTDLLSTPHTDFSAWRRRMIRAKTTVYVLSTLIERAARAAARRVLH